MSSYADFSLKPKIEIGPNSFKITLPNVNYYKDKEFISTSKFDDKAYNLSKTEKMVVNYLQKNKKASRSNIQTAIGKSQTSTIVVLKSLLEKKIIIRLGNNRNFVYKLNE